MRRALRGFVFLVLAVDAAVAVLVLGGAMLETSATTTAAPAAGPAATAEAPASVSKPAPPAEAARPAATPPAPSQASDQGEPVIGPSPNELPMSSPPAETAPSDAIPGVAAMDAIAPGPAAVPGDPSAAAPARAALKNDAFLRLQRAYESMEPESAAKALIALAGRDQEAVIELLMGWKPRTSGAILDAVTQTNPSLAADLSYQIWKRSGSAADAPARTGR